MSRIFLALAVFLGVSWLLKKTRMWMASQETTPEPEQEVKGSPRNVNREIDPDDIIDAEYHDVEEK